MDNCSSFNGPLGSRARHFLHDGWVHPHSDRRGGGDGSNQSDQRSAVVSLAIIHSAEANNLG